MKGQEKGVILIEVTACAGLTVSLLILLLETIIIWQYKTYIYKILYNEMDRKKKK